MGSRPSSFKKGGGYLNEVDVTLVGYTFEVGDEAVIKKGARKGETFTPLSFVPEFQVDGEDETKTQRLLIGDAEFFGDVSDDGRTLYTPEGQGISARSEAGLFIASLCDGGFPEEQFSDDETEINFEPAIGCRMRLVQQINAEKTARQGKQKGKDGKEYDRKDLLVQTVHDLPGPAVKGKTNGKAATPAKGAKGAKGKASGPSEDEIAELASETILALVGEKGKLAKSKLSMGFLKALMKDPNRDAAREWALDDDNLGSVEGISYNKKTQTLTLDE